MRTDRRLAILAALLLACSGGSRTTTTPSNTAVSSEKSTPAPAVRQWRVFAGDVEILEVRDEPGSLRSTAPLPPGATPPAHPFLSATALDASHEDQLRALLDGAKTTDDFIAALERAGFRVVVE